jgi:hypothetical protein
MLICGAMFTEDPRIRSGWLVEGFRGPEEDERIRAWRRAHPDFARWTHDWFHVECSSDFVADDSDPQGGGGSSLIFRTRETAEKYGLRDEAIASGVRRVDPVHYVDASLFRAPDVERDEWVARRREICASVASRPGCGLFERSLVLFTPATDDAAAALATALKRMDELQAWAREQEKRFVEEAEGA